MQLIFRLKKGESSIFWLTNLRWIAAVCVLVSVTGTRLMDLALPVLPLYTINALIFIRKRRPDLPGAAAFAGGSDGAGKRVGFFRKIQRE